ncbi:uncharacterized protein [Mycetomoellerius zeteki]|uniref:uncharacterized protein n=1 Tax=Mycetomoellerius zeteki TaxID=64791 RepID=UPI00084E9951|nr:PREDICTED: uncharacterized protein LOC108730377 [Trachymyrmex zeteki]
MFTEAFESSSTNTADTSKQSTTAALNELAINELVPKSRAEQMFTACAITDTRDVGRVGFMDVGIQTSVMQQNVGVQVKIRPHYRSVHTTCNISVSTVNKCSSPIKLPIHANIAISPTKIIISKTTCTNYSILTSTISTIDIGSSHDYYMPSDQTSLDDPSSPNKKDRDILNITNYLISTNIKAYLGIPNEWNCELIKPPSVSSIHKPTKSEVLETKRIASLRIHIERVIGRLREFDFLKPHAVISHSMLSDTDDIIVIASALINLQSPIIKI